MIDFLSPGLATVPGAAAPGAPAFLWIVPLMASLPARPAWPLPASSRPAPSSARSSCRGSRRPRPRRPCGAWPGRRRAASPRSRRRAGLDDAQRRLRPARPAAGAGAAAGLRRRPACAAGVGAVAAGAARGRGGGRFGGGLRGGFAGAQLGGLALGALLRLAAALLLRQLFFLTRSSSASACASSSRRRSSASSTPAAAGVLVDRRGASSRLTKVRFLRTSTWIVRALPLASACLISLVDLRVSVIFLRSPPATVPCDERRWSSRRSLSLSVSESSVDALLTPADCSCSSSAAAGRFSSAASWATVVRPYVCLSLRCGFLRRRCRCVLRLRR